MLIKNLRNSSGELTLCNGSQGIVKEFRKVFRDGKEIGFSDFPVVRFTNGVERVIEEED